MSVLVRPTALWTLRGPVQSSERLYRLPAPAPAPEAVAATDLDRERYVPVRPLPGLLGRRLGLWRVVGPETTHLTGATRAVPPAQWAPPRRVGQMHREPDSTTPLDPGDLAPARPWWDPVPEGFHEGRPVVRSAPRRPGPAARRGSSTPTPAPDARAGGLRKMPSPASPRAVPPRRRAR